MSLPDLDRRVWTILLIVFVQMVGASMIVPILPLYAERTFDLQPQVITLLLTAFFAAQFVAGPYLGRLSDRRGRIPVLMLSQMGTAVSFAMLGLAGSVWMLFVARILDGITGGNIIVAQAYITDVMPKERRTEALGYIFAAFGIGFIIGPALGSLLSTAFGPRIPYLFAAAAATVTFLLSWRVLDETVTPEMQAAQRDHPADRLTLPVLLGNGPLLLIFAVGFVGQFGLGTLQATFALYGDAVLFAGYSEQATNIGIGVLLSIVGVAQFGTQAAVLPRLAARFPDTWLVVGGTLVRGVGMLLFAVAAAPLLGGVAALVFALGSGTMMPPLQSLATTSVSEDIRGGILGVFQSVTSVATILSTAISGTIFAIRPALPLWIGAVITFVVLIPALILVRQLPDAAPRLPKAA